MRWRERSEGTESLLRWEGLFRSGALHSALRSRSPERAHAYSYTSGCFIYLCIRLKITPARRHDQRWERYFILQCWLYMSRLWAMGEKEDWQLWEEREIQTKRGWLIQLHVLWMDEQLQAKCVGVMLGEDKEKKKSHSHTQTMMKSSSFLHCLSSSSNTFVCLLGCKI